MTPEQTSRILFEAIESGDTAALARGITLVESHRSIDFDSRVELARFCLDSPRRSNRIAITGMPGSGKSTLIDTLGESLISQGHRVAVLAIDPTSQASGGSILGDKTRMVNLASNTNAFIRPSPTAGILGGITAMTRESAALCTAAGFDTIIIETVGVGQSEISVRDVVDFVAYITIAGTGDDLQNIKRGIMETVDAVIVNKSDGDRISSSKQLAAQIRNTLPLLTPRFATWKPEVHTISAIESVGIEEFRSHIESFFNELEPTGVLEEQRALQRLSWFREAVTYCLNMSLAGSESYQHHRIRLEEQILESNANPLQSARDLVSGLFRK